MCINREYRAAAAVKSSVFLERAICGAPGNFGGNVIILQYETQTGAKCHTWTRDKESLRAKLREIQKDRKHMRSCDVCLSLPGAGRCIVTFVVQGTEIVDIKRIDEDIANREDLYF